MINKLTKYNGWVKKMQTSLEVALLYKIEEFMDEFMCSDSFIEIIEELIKDGQFDDVIYDRFISGNNTMIDDFCDDCENKCEDTCPGRHLRG